MRSVIDGTGSPALEGRLRDKADCWPRCPLRCFGPRPRKGIRGSSPGLHLTVGCGVGGGTLVRRHQDNPVSRAILRSVLSACPRQPGGRVGSRRQRVFRREGARLTTVHSLHCPVVHGCDPCSWVERIRGPSSYGSSTLPARKPDGGGHTPEPLRTPGVTWRTRGASALQTRPALRMSRSDNTHLPACLLEHVERPL